MPLEHVLLLLPASVSAPPLTLEGPKIQEGKIYETTHIYYKASTQLFIYRHVKYSHYMSLFMA